MWSSDAMLDGGLSLAKGITSFIQSSREQKYREKLQAYNNAMLGLQNAANQNGITTNQNLAVEQSLAKQFQIERQEYTTLGEGEVAAAASDTEGRSVNQTMFQIQRSAAEAESNRKTELETQLLAFNQQRLSSAFATATQIDRSFIPKANPVSAMLGIATDLYSIEKRYNPKTI